jgi:hypothetical protein
MNTKRVFGILLTILFACSAASAQCTRCGSRLVVRPTSLDFGNETVGKGKILSILIIAEGTFPTTGIQISKTGPAAFSETNNCPGTMTAGQTCHISVAFTPKHTGAFSGNITVHSSGGGGTVSLSGMGVE